MSIRKKLEGHNLGIRTMSCVLIAVVMITLYVLGEWTWFAGTAVFSCLGLYEFYKVYGIERKAAGISGFLYTAVYLLLTALHRYDLYMTVFLLLFLTLASVYVLGFEKVHAKDVLAAFFGFFYVPVLLSFMYRVRILENGKYLVLLIFIGAWMCDTFAYFTGVLLGKHKLAPVLSPKKSVEGAVGGVLGAALTGVLFGMIFKNSLSVFPAPAFACGVICMFSALVSMIGDLLASAFKRETGIKDYSNLIPGHGGILDRFDSIITVAPVIFIVAGLFMK